MKSFLKYSFAIIVFTIFVLKPFTVNAEYNGNLDDLDVIETPTSSPQTPSGPTSKPTSYAIVSSQLDCISDGIRDFTRNTFHNEVTPSEKWLTFLGVGVNMYTSQSANNTRPLNAARRPEDRKILLRKTIRLVQAYGFCNADDDTKISDLQYKDLSFAPGYLKIKAFDGTVRGNEKEFVTDYVSGRSHIYLSKERDNHYTQAMSEIFGVNQSGFKLLFDNLGSMTGRSLEASHFEPFMDQVTKVGPNSESGIMGHKGYTGNSTMMNSENYNYNEMRSCMNQIEKRKRASPYFQAETQNNIDLCNAMVKSCGLMEGNKLESVCYKQGAQTLPPNVQAPSAPVKSSDPFLNPPVKPEQPKPVATAPIPKPVVTEPAKPITKPIAKPITKPVVKPIAKKPVVKPAPKPVVTDPSPLPPPPPPRSEDGAVK